MNKLEKDIRHQFVICIIASIMFVAGIPMIVMGAVNKIWAVMGIGIAFVVIGFYGMPFMWVNYGTKRGYKRIVFAVTQEHISDIGQLSLHLDSNPKDVRTKLQACIQKGYLVGYLFDGNSLKGNFNKPIGTQQRAVQCNACGARFTHAESADPICPYCGTLHQ